MGQEGKSVSGMRGGSLSGIKRKNCVWCKKGKVYSMVGVHSYPMYPFRSTPEELGTTKETVILTVCFPISSILYSLFYPKKITSNLVILLPFCISPVIGIF